MRVGLCIPIGERGPERQARSYVEMREMALLAEESGIDSIWVADHLFFVGRKGDVSGVWESLSMLSALAEATSRVELGPLVLCAPFRNAGMIAWMANTLDEISGGRFVLGLGSGWSEHEFRAFGFEFDHRVSLFADQLEVLVPLLREGRTDHSGRWASGAAELRPPGPRAAGPPILIAGSMPRMMSLVARWADRWNSVWYGLPDAEFRSERANLAAACRATGRDPATIEITAGVVVADSEAIAAAWPNAIPHHVERIAETIVAWRDEGVDEVMWRMEPPSVEAIDLVAEATRRTR